MLEVPRAVEVPFCGEVDLGSRVGQDKTFRSLLEVLASLWGLRGGCSLA